MNVQQTIIKGIRNLLFVHNYLVLPDFGGFVLKPAPAHIAASGGQMFPPSKTVSFNAQLKQNDGVLAIWLQEQLQCGAAEALAHLQDFAGFCSSILAAKRRLTLDRIGFFYLDFENNICFEPQPDSNFLSASFGLGPVAMREIETQEPEPKRQPVFEDRAPHRAEAAEQQRMSRNYRRLVIPVVATALLFSLLVLFVSTTRFTGPLRASLFGNQSKTAYQPLPYPDLNLMPAKQRPTAYVADANGIATLELDNDTRLAVKAVEETTHPTLIKHHSPRQKKQGRFEIVLGCFTVLENASRMAAKLERRNVAAEVAGRNEKGMYVVSHGQFETREEAVLQLSAIKENFPNAWIRKGD